MNGTSQAALHQPRHSSVTGVPVQRAEEGAESERDMSLTIGENSVGLISFLEPLLGPGVTVLVRVVFEGHLAVCLLNLIVAGGATHSENLVGEG